jgi:aconitate hydratase
LALGSRVFVPFVRKALLEGTEPLTAWVIDGRGKTEKITLQLGAMTEDERQILADGCLINYYKR